MSDDPAFSSDATPPWLRPEIPEHLRPFAAPPRPAQAPTVPGPRDTDGAAPSVSRGPGTVGAWAGLGGAANGRRCSGISGLSQGGVAADEQAGSSLMVVPLSRP
ncbi:hypothetical protein, partial [Streptomyces caniscabiei]|uniref:hypothetical protein n=1 Tax=Streptomyces caniscabiei TaxID=2746961 RepID=UPI0015C502E7